ncbi:polysaccharide deacetylase family protein [Actinoplanes ianthinogenes]|uniref:polysaccharide deacetylase family protein n=1 Tax=Actinoplanes ianthinogenes TaxID=122358 RepID=UPI00166FC254|nr:polysaccharide deacetylase family protein [Actinoplanes ianthinogenes]
MTKPGGTTPDQRGDEAPTEAVPALPEAETDDRTVALTAVPDVDEETVTLPETDETISVHPETDEKTVTLSEVPDEEEKTVTLTAAQADDETVAPASTPEEDDETIALTSAPEADDETVALTSAPEADEKTVALTSAPEADEMTVALSAVPETDEKTVTLSAVPETDEKTVTLSAAAKPADEATVMFRAERPPVPVQPAAQATTVLPPAPPAAPAPPGGSRPSGIPLTRRRLLLGLSGVAGTALAATAAVALTTTDDPVTSPSKPAVPAQPTTTKPRVPESTTTTAPVLPVQRKPISTLAEYAKAAGKPAFPSDAVALTIDDGPHPIWTPKILRLLEKYQVPALFCMIGNQVLGHETVAQLVTKDGHQLANHTWSHPTHLGKKAKTIAEREIRKAQSKIVKTTGYEPKLFRSPGGDWSPQLLRDVAQAGLLPLDWSNDPRDWTMPGAPAIEHRMLAARPGQILLCHDGGGDRSQTYQALSVVLPQLKARGLQFVAL